MSGQRTESGRNAGPRPCVLVVDDEPDIRELLDLSLARMGLDAMCAGSIAEAKSALAGRRFQLCLTDMRLPDGEGIELVRYIAALTDDLPVAVITAHGSAENAVSALKAGAFDYIAKPVSLDQLRGLVRSALDIAPPANAGAATPILELLGNSPAIEHARTLIARVARSQAPVYITGESGTGKELAAHLVHAQSNRAGKPFVPVNCGAIPENLVESEFFGYRKGSFTGAAEDRDGFFQAANGGTLFLDEVADLPLAMQVKLLRAIQEKRVRKVGATTEEAVDVRLICATHQELRKLVAQGRFRQDLFYRINVIELRMPPLRECRDDIPQLVTHLVARLAPELDAMRAVTPALLRVLADYPFPGNVRELENMIERALALRTSDVIATEDLGIFVEEAQSAESGAVGASLQDHLDQVERQAILAALEQARGNRTAAAKLLGISFRSMRYRMARLSIGGDT
jgi:two-component system response regulator PilR (NtrC family)